jgi:outer membrane receptor protein involved in Fe transport
MSVSLKAANQYSRNNLPEAPQSEFIQTRGVGSSTPNTIPEDLTNLISYGGTDNVYLNTLTLFSSDYKENGQSYLGDFKFPFGFGADFVGYFKFGGQYNYTTHKNAQNTPYATIGGTNDIQTAITNGILQQHPELIFNSGINRFPSTSFTTTNPAIYNDSFLDNNFGSLIWANDASLLSDIIYYVSGDPQFSSYNATATQPGGWFDGYFQTLPNTYKYVEQYYAGFLMSELNYGDLMIVGGARYEKVKSLYEAYNLKDGRDTKSQQYFTVTANPENEFWLPMVQARYKATDWFDLRAAYTQTLARPDYHQLSPHFTISYASNTVRASNPDLRPAHAYNHDLIFTFYNNEL